MSSAQGEDRSDYQLVMPPVDKRGKKLDFILFKATEGTSWISTNYKSNIRQAKAQGVPFGSYHFLHPNLDVNEQVALFMATVAENGGLEAGAMLAVDSELSLNSASKLQLASNRSHLLYYDTPADEVRIRTGVAYPRHVFSSNKPKVIDAVSFNVGTATRDFITGVRTAVEVALGGDYCQELIYTFEAMLSDLATCTEFPLWVAYFSNTPPVVHPWPNWTLWQYAGGGGNGGSDQDAYNGSSLEFTSWVNAKRGKPVVTPPHVDTSTFTILMPDLSRGAASANPDWYVLRAQWLIAGIGKHNNLPNTQITDDGTFGPATEAAVKEIQVYARLARSTASASGKIGQAEWQFLIAGKFGNA